MKKNRTIYVGHGITVNITRSTPKIDVKKFPKVIVWTMQRGTVKRNAYRTRAHCSRCNGPLYKTKDASRLCVRCGRTEINDWGSGLDHALFMLECINATVSQEVPIPNVIGNTLIVEAHG